MQFDPNSPDFQANPYPFYDTLRAQSPITFWEQGNMWLFTRYEDITALLRDKRLGRTMDHIIIREQRNIPPILEAEAPFYKLSQHSMFDKEPPDHTRLRSLVHKVFTPRRVENLRGRIQLIADDLLDKIVQQGHMDILEDFAVPLPVTVIAELLGVPESDRHLLRPWSRDIVAMFELGHTEEQSRRAVQAAVEFSDYLRALANERRRNPGEDLISALALVEESGDQLTEDELISTCVLLLNAGHEATVNVIGNGMLALLKHPDQMTALLQNPALINSTVEEMLRYDTPLQLFRRWILEDLDYKGFSFKQGTEVALMFGAANRDPARFPEPHTFDITRADNQHVSFGNGIHFCLGAPLARLELQIALGTLLRRLPNLRLGDEPHFRPAYVIRGLQELNVTFVTEFDHLTAHLEKIGSWIAQGVNVGRESVLRTPQMYIGREWDADGLYFLLGLIMKLAVRPESANRCSVLKLAIEDATVVSITDDGRGIPTESIRIGKSVERPRIEHVFSSPLTTNPLPAFYETFGFLDTYGFVLNAVSKLLQVETYFEAQRYELICGRGEIITNLRTMETSAAQNKGTRLTFTPDPAIFPDFQFDFESLHSQLRELKQEFPLVKVILEDKRSNQKMEVLSPV